MKLRTRVALLSGGLLLALAGCGVRGVQMQESSLLRMFEPKRGLISYVGPDGNIYTIDQAGGNRSQVTTDARRSDQGSMTYNAPTWSFDGKHLAYAMYRDDPTGTHLEGALLLTGRDGSNPRTLTRDTARIPFYIYFAPDSRHVSLLSERSAEQTYELGIMPVREEGPYQKLDSGVPYTWIWRMDGKSLVAYVDGERVSVIDIDPEPRRRDLPVSPGPFQAPDVSADGKRLLYVTGSLGDSRLVLRELDGGTETEIHRAVGALYFAFSPDGKAVAFLESTSGTFLPVGRLTIVRPGTRTAPVILKEPSVLGFYWAPDSRKLAFFIPSPPEKAGDLEPAFALDENLAYIAIMVADARSGRSWLGARFPSTNGFFNNLPYFDQLQRSDTLWSPDSRYFVFSAYAADSEAALFIAQADGNLKPRFIDYGENASWSRR
jgi:Tol biopolymer transport system component